MDTSNRLEFLLGNLRIEAREISSATWVDLFRFILNELKGRLKYYDFFYELKDHLNDRNISINGYKLVTDMGLITLATNMKPKNRFMTLVRKNPIDNVDFDSSLFIQEIILLDQNGKLFSFEGEFRGSERTQGTVLLRAIDGHVTELNDSDLCKKFEADPHEPARAPRTLFTSIECAAEKSRGRLTQLEADKIRVGEILRRVQW